MRTYRVLPILILVQVANLREHHATCPPHLIKHTHTQSSNIRGKIDKILGAVIDCIRRNYKSGNVPGSTKSDARTSCKSERASCQMSSSSDKTYNISIRC